MLFSHIGNVSAVLIGNVYAMLISNVCAEMLGNAHAVLVMFAQRCSVMLTQCRLTFEQPRSKEGLGGRSGGVQLTVWSPK